MQNSNMGLNDQFGQILKQYFEYFSSYKHFS